MFRLHVRLVELMHPDETDFRQAARDVFAPGLASVIFVEHDDDVALIVGVLADQFLLRGGHRAAHKRNHFAATMLVQLHGVEETFNDDERLVGRFFDGAVKVEQLLRLSESRRQFVFGRILAGFAGKPSRIRNDLTFDVVNRDGDAVGHHALGTKADAEIHDGFWRQPALFRQIRMRALQFIQPEFQRRIGGISLPN